MYSLYCVGNETTTNYKSYDEICQALDISIYTVRRLFLYSEGKLKKPRKNKQAGDLYDMYIIRKIPKDGKAEEVKEEEPEAKEDEIMSVSSTNTDDLIIVD